MESLSISTHRGFVHWQGLLLVVSLLNFWGQPTTAQVTVLSADCLEGHDVTLRIRHHTPNAELFLWYRGGIIDNDQHIAYLSVHEGNYVRGPPGGQAIVIGDGSLVLTNVSMEDAGIYTVVVQIQGCQQMIACGRLDVYPYVRGPILTASNTTVNEYDGVIFTCNTNADIIEWFFNHSSLKYTERMILSIDRKNLTIDPVLRWDAGYYQCKGSNPRISGKTAPLKLRVKWK
ncbi:carcinoembryonic antigen-related cell adhesion molecule 21-like [Sturnira hondurensis]|uniref:carcinoembryonic antigen-related cell adhesion molecule 21-like n=1 Tax=Sturnira hondurensis TaxID=192404 RepID=UPI00187AD448|nr:carcinoembryonic antigen-related cell adhesion molecule 21-like [Sturnira hondurensis]